MYITDEKIINAVYNVFETRIELHNGQFVVVDADNRTDHLLVKHINEYIQFLNRRHAIS